MPPRGASLTLPGDEHPVSNANGVEALSPGLVRGTRTTLGTPIDAGSNRNAVVAVTSCNPRAGAMVRIGGATTALRLASDGPVTQGSLASSANPGLAARIPLGFTEPTQSRRGERSKFSGSSGEAG